MAPIRALVVSGSRELFGRDPLGVGKRHFQPGLSALRALQVVWSVGRELLLRLGEFVNPGGHCVHGAGSSIAAACWWS